MKEVRTAIVGMGIGRQNGRAIARNPRGRVVALCDLIEERMEDFAKELPEPVKFYIDYREMRRDPDIDAVFVGTPNQVHVPVALEAVQQGKHVLVTKPLADSEKAAMRLVDAAEAAGVVHMMFSVHALLRPSTLPRPAGAAGRTRRAVLRPRPERPAQWDPGLEPGFHPGGGRGLPRYWGSTYWTRRGG